MKKKKIIIIQTGKNKYFFISFVDKILDSTDSARAFVSLKMFMPVVKILISWQQMLTIYICLFVCFYIHQNDIVSFQHFRKKSVFIYASIYYLHFAIFSYSFHLTGSYNAYRTNFWAFNVYCIRICECLVGYLFGEYETKCTSWILVYGSMNIFRLNNQYPFCLKAIFCSLFICRHIFLNVRYQLAMQLELYSICDNKKEKFIKISFR